MADEIIENNELNIDENLQNDELHAEIMDVEQIEGDFIIESPEIKYHLQDWEGPFDLLYALIKSAKINIEDIFISDVTSQYVEIVTNQPKDEIDYEYAGEFITLAAELIYLKSIRTLPKEDEEITPDDPEWERIQFINKMKQFQLLKEESEKLREIETTNRFYRQPTYTDKDFRVALVNFNLPKLTEAFAKILAAAEVRGQEIIPKKVVKERFSVSDKMIDIRACIKTYHEMNFTDLFEPDYQKSDIITTFLAVLELLKYGIITAEQDETFGSITIFEVEGADEIYFNLDEESDYGKN